MKRYFVVVGAAGVVMAAVLAYSPTPAGAITGSQAACSEDSAPNGFPTFIPVAGLSATSTTAR